jgi:hypothetical protein
MFYGVPALLAGVLVWQGEAISQNLVNLLVTSYSVFAALLFNLLVLLYTVVERYNRKVTQERIPEAADLLREVYANVSFGILLCIVAVVGLIVSFIDVGTFRCVVDGVNWFIGICFLLTLFMILRRIHALLSLELPDE